MTPFVGCFCLIDIRREFIPRSLKSCQSQTYSRLELIVVDDGTDRIADLIPDDPRIHYSAFAGRENHGRKMNRCCAVAAGDFRVVTNDDYPTPQDRVERLATGLLGGEKVVVAGISRVVDNHIVTIRATETHTIPTARQRPKTVHSLSRAPGEQTVAY